ncbi:hypothetical protein FB451DRAFT_1172379 [Mycena latifolia]|nr:hypothetical protein FB451DRAFT_1172379 [Mycena latifolia]
MRVPTNAELVMRATRQLLLTLFLYRISASANWELSSDPARTTRVEFGEIQYLKRIKLMRARWDSDSIFENRNEVSGDEVELRWIARDLRVLQARETGERVIRRKKQNLDEESRMPYETFYLTRVSAKRVLFGGLEREKRIEY